MSGQCSICLNDYKDPVCIPCGHIYCTQCIIDHVNVPTNNEINSSCPICREKFHLVVPDLTYLHKKYHPFIVPSVRRVYIDNSNSTALQAKVKQHEKTIKRLKQKEETLMKQCERSNEAVYAHRAGEQEARLLLERARQVLDESKYAYDDEKEATKKKLATLSAEKDKILTKYSDLKVRYSELQNRNDNLKQEAETSVRRQREVLVMSDSEDEEVPEPARMMPITRNPPRRIRPLPQRARVVLRLRSESPPPVYETRIKRPRHSAPITLLPRISLRDSS